MSLKEEEVSTGSLLVSLSLKKGLGGELGRLEKKKRLDQVGVDLKKKWVQVFQKKMSDERKIKGKIK